MTRLSNDDLVDLERWAADDLRGDEQGGVWSLVDEVRALRLTDEERAALEWAAGEIRSLHWPHETSDRLKAEQALAVLDRLIGKAGHGEV